MNTERTAELARRAAIHAALADPARLAIVDTLAIGDASPSELQAALAMPSNLLAHHLKVLQDAALVTRSRSEADRRRTYVQLVPGSLDGVTAGAPGSASRLVFICTANTARSQLAAALWRRASNIPAVSAGTHPSERIDPGALAVAARRELPLPRRRPKAVADVMDLDHLSTAVNARAELVVTVCDNAHEELGDVGGVHWSVPDPVRIGTDAAFDAAYAEIDRRVDALAARLVAS